MKSKFNLYSRLTGEPRVITLRCWAITDKNGNIRRFRTQEGRRAPVIRLTKKVAQAHSVPGEKVVAVRVTVEAE